MKRFLALFLITGIILGGCGGSKEETAETAETETEAVETTETEETEEETEEAEAEEESAETSSEEAAVPEETAAPETEAAPPETTAAPVTEAPTEAPAAPAETQPEKTAASCGEIYSKCTASGAFEELVAYDETYMLNYFGIDTAALEDYAAGEALDAVKADALIILKAKDSSQAGELEAKLNNYINRKKAELENYNAEEFKKASAGIVGTSGNYVYLIVCGNPSSVLSTIEGNI